MKRRKKEENSNKSGKRKILIALGIAFLFFLAILFGFFTYIFFNAPEFNSNLLYSQESTNIFDSKGELITTIGTEKRELVEYKELPQVLIDAIVATEDSRFFEHDGFDLPRFMKAGFGFVSGVDAGGASTLTMQLSKNTFTSTEASGFNGIVRKFTDIYMSIFKIERDYSKEEIIEFYVNAPYLGSGSYGVEMASQTYFGKSVTKLNLVEAATIAGLFQAPGEYDPYINPNKANARKNIVIDLMVRHGYITETEATAAKKIKVSKILKKQNSRVNEYQGFIDTVVAEVIERTGNNPYEVSMDIYSTMVRSKQDGINKFYKNWKFKDKKVQVGIGVIDNDSGAIIAVGAGRNKKTELSFNYATQIKRHPGSTAKPLFDYGPGIEYLNWSTYTPFIDKPVKYTNGGTMHNVDNSYLGFMTLEQCLVQSRNTCALQAFQKVSNSKINKFVTSLGITPEYLSNSTFIHEAHSIGAFTGVNPVQLAGAYAAFGNGGYYTQPHSIEKIVYKNAGEEETVRFDFKKKRAMKATTAYMISYMLKGVTSSSIKVEGTDLASKTGTSSYDTKTLRRMGLTNNVIQDAWTATFSPDYTVAIWYGYDKLSKKYHNTTSHAWSERTRIQKSVVTKIMKKNSRFKRPSGIVQATVAVGTNPPLLANSSSRAQTHLFIKGTQPTKVATYTPTVKKNNTTKKSNNSSSNNTDGSSTPSTPATPQQTQEVPQELEP